MQTAHRQSNQCKKYTLYFKWTYCVDHFFFGYITSSITESIKSWTGYMGHRMNKENSVGIFVSKSNTYLYIHDKHNDYKNIGPSLSNHFKKGDIFKMEFNFTNNEVNLYCNELSVGQIPLKDFQSITAAFSLGYKHEEIQITKWEFE